MNGHRDGAGTSRTRGFALALAATILTMAAASAPSLFYPQLADRLDLSPFATTLVFAVYTFTLLGSLLCLGSLSDRIGRRPVLALGALLLAASLLLFWAAGSLTNLVFARALQGAAAGLLVPTMSAMMIDFEGPSRPGTAALWNTIAPMLGLAGGALGAAILLDLFADADFAVFGVLVASFVAVAALVWTTPEVISPTRVRLVDLRPTFRAPADVRARLVAGVPAIIAGWATNGLFLALGAGLVSAELGGTTHTAAGVVIATLALSGVLTSRLMQHRSARTISLYATSALALGTAFSILALAIRSYPGYVIAVAVVGSGFGTAFLGVLRTVLPATDPSERSAVMAVIYTIAYLAFGVPTIVAGLLVPELTLVGTMTLLGTAICALGIVATVLRLRVPDQDPDHHR